jgi:hypothetical protein
MLHSWEDYGDPTLEIEQNKHQSNLQKNPSTQVWKLHSSQCPILTFNYFELPHNRKEKVSCSINRQLY